MTISSSELARLLRLTSRSQTYKQQLDALNRIVKSIQPTKYLEIGAFEGRSLLLYSALASLQVQARPLHVTSIDSWLGGDEHRESSVPMKHVEAIYDDVAIACSAFVEGQLHCEKIKQLSTEGLRKIAERKSYYDLILIDASHKATDVLADLVNAWPLLREGGVMILDDYTWIPQHKTDCAFLNSPKIAIDSFCNCYAEELLIISNMPLLQLYLLKIPASKRRGFAMTLPEADIPTIFSEAGLF